MALQDTWRDLIDHESLVQASDINSIANAVIALERAKADGTIINKEAVVNALDYTPADEEAVSNELGTETLETEAQTVKGAINELKRTSSLTKIINNASGEMITLKDATNDYYESINIYGKSTQDGTPTPEAPVPIVSVGDDGTAEVTSSGKNLLDLTALTNGTNQGVTSEVSEKSITVTVTAITGGFQQWTGEISGKRLTALIGKTLTVSCGEWSNTDSAANPNMTIAQYAEGAPNGDRSVYLKSENSATFEVKEDTTLIKFIFRVDQNKASAVGTVAYFGKLMLELGTTATAYEPYKGTTATLTTALPLCSVGDVRDEVIFNADGTGKVIKRIGYKEFDGSEPFLFSTGYFFIGHSVLGGKRSIAYCSHFENAETNADGTFFLGAAGAAFFKNDCTSVDEFKAYLVEQKANGNPVTLINPLATPEEINLTGAEVIALKSLMSYRGTTNVFNDGGSEMEIEYTADMKAYIDSILGVGG